MNAFKNRKTAIFITALVSAIAVLFGVHKSLNGLAREIENSFYTGVYLESEGYTQASIDSHLKKIAEAALGMVSIASNYPELETAAEDLRWARQELLSAGDISEKNIAYTHMQKAFTLFEEAEKGVSFPTRDSDALTSCRTTYSGAAAAIASSNYQDAVDGFIRGESYSFIAYTLKPIAFVTPPESFS